MIKKSSNPAKQWRVMDLHIHTPASADYQQPEVTYLEILQKAETRGLDMIAFTDHNTIAGYRKMMDEVQQLEWLKKLNRLVPEENNRLKEYQRLLNKICVLPGFEFTATFGFHILAIFPPQKPIREIEHLLLTLNVPADQLDSGSMTVGAATEVLGAYRLINQAGGLVIAAHANSTNGVAMRGFNFGGQTKIAYTQDPYLHALEVTDLELKGPRTTAAFFNGTKPEYPRRMHCIQGSDCHRLTQDSSRKKNLGLGDRATDVLLPEVSFEALLQLFSSNDFSRTSPHRFKEEPVFDFIQQAREEGANIIQDFYENMNVRGGNFYSLLADVCAFANTNGGTLYVGLGAEKNTPPTGIADADQGITLLEKEIASRISPPLSCSLDIHEFKKKKIIRVLVPRGDDPPYAVDDNKIYIRDEAETGLAVRDEIVGLVLRGKNNPSVSISPLPLSQPILPIEPQIILVEPQQPNQTTSNPIEPQTGVEVLPPVERQGKIYFTMRDLRNGNLVKNVTRASARRLWHYAIALYEEIGPHAEQAKIQWQGNFGLIKVLRQGANVRYDLIYRGPQGYRFFFGVTPDGIHGPWKGLIGDEEIV